MLGQVQGSKQIQPQAVRHGPQGVHRGVPGSQACGPIEGLARRAGMEAIEIHHPEPHPGPGIAGIKPHQSRAVTPRFLQFIA